MKRRWPGLGAVKTEEGSAEVTSSTLLMSPDNSLASNDIGDVDLEFWDLDISHQNQNRGFIIQNGYGVQGHTVLGQSVVAKSDTSSMSGMEVATWPSAFDSGPVSRNHCFHY